MNRQAPQEKGGQVLYFSILFGSRARMQKPRHVCTGVAFLQGENRGTPLPFADLDLHEDGCRDQTSTSRYRGLADSVWWSKSCASSLGRRAFNSEQ